MTEVVSVNGKTGAVVLTATDVEAAPDSVTPKLVEAGEVEGAYEPNCANGNVFDVVAKGHVTIKLPINTPRTLYYVELVLAENATGGHELSTEGYVLLGEAPTLNTAANAVNVLQAFTLNGGSSWYLVGLQAGKEGAEGKEGKAGPEGKEGFSSGKLLLPKKVKTYKETGASTLEERAALAESFPRKDFGNSFLLASGTPIAAAIEVPAKTVINAIGFYVVSLEETPADRTHMWVALLNEKFEVLKRGLDYTSSTNTPFGVTSLRALRLESSYETGSETALLYGVICEVMSSSKPITIGTKEGTAADEATPALSGSLNTGLTTPASLPEKATLTPNTKPPYMVVL